MAHYTKKELAKVKPGTWLTVKWKDGPLSTVMLLEKMDPKQLGDISLMVFDIENGANPICYITHTLVVGVGSRVVVPEPVETVKADEPADQPKPLTTESREWPYKG